MHLDKLVANQRNSTHRHTMPLAAPMAINSIAGASGMRLIDVRDRVEQVEMTQ
jgi:hypothetical protein